MWIVRYLVDAANDSECPNLRIRTEILYNFDSREEGSS